MQSIPASVLKQFEELENKLHKAPSLDFNFEYDQIVCFGELVSTCIVSAFLNSSGKTNQLVDARSVIRTDYQYRDANVNWELTEKFCRNAFTFNDCQLYITQGFIGSTPTNLTTTLAVSYTHLDVYKRQIQSRLFASIPKPGHRKKQTHWLQKLLTKSKKLSKFSLITNELNLKCTK